MDYHYVLQITIKNKNKERRIWNARSKNISLRGTSDKYSMVRSLGRSIDRDQSFIPRCVDIPLFFILVIETGRGEEINPLLFFVVFFFFSNSKEKRKKKKWIQPQWNLQSGPGFQLNFINNEAENRIASAGQQSHTRYLNKKRK